MDLRPALVLLLVVVAPSAEACEYCLLGQGISPLQTQTGAGVRVAQRYTLLDSVYEGDNEVSNPGVKEQYWTTDVVGFFSIADRLQLLVNAPIRKTEGNGELTKGPNGEPEREDETGDASGLGDVTLLARYTLLGRHSAAGTTLLAGIVGVKLPTGSTNQHDDEGGYLDSHLQLGTGSTDALLGLSVDHAADRWSLSANALVSITGDGEVGDESHQFGDSLNYDVTAKYRMTPATLGQSPNAWFVSLGINGEAREHEHLDGQRVADSGGHVVYLTPGVQWVVGNSWVVEATYQYAIYHDLDDLQLGEDYKIFGSVTYLF
jgi:Putative MetA-pathway of phenol degradation